MKTIKNTSDKGILFWKDPFMGLKPGREVEVEDVIVDEALKIEGIELVKEKKVKKKAKK